MTNKELLEKVNELYEKRGAWISDIATELHTPYETIRQIIVALGFYRGRKIKEVPLNTLLYDSYIRNSLEIISCNL